LLDGAKHPKALDGFACLSPCKKRDPLTTGFSLMSCVPDVSTLPEALGGETPTLNHVTHVFEFAGDHWRLSVFRNQSAVPANVVLSCDWKDVTHAKPK